MNDVNNDVQDRTKDIHSCFQCKQMSTLRRSSSERVYNGHLRGPVTLTPIAEPVDPSLVPVFTA